MSQKIYQVDAFTGQPFSGNPAGVCILDGPAEETWMQNVAAEMNLAETAFLYPVEDGYNLRWFTPAVEVDLCGHATLASAFVLYETGLLGKNERATFFTKSGTLTADKLDDKIELDFPATPASPVQPDPRLTAALGVTALWIGRNEYDYLVQVENEKVIPQLSPDMNQLKSLTERGVIVTAESSSPEYDFVSRFFAPAAGIDEDPVTGSAHCTLAPFWGERLNKTKFVAFQASKRGGVVEAELSGNRVKLRGQAVMTLVGELLF